MVVHRKTRTRTTSAIKPKKKLTAEEKRVKRIREKERRRVKNSNKKDVELKTECDVRVYTVKQDSRGITVLNTEDDPTWPPSDQVLRADSSVKYLTLANFSHKGRDATSPISDKPQVSVTTSRRVGRFGVALKTAAYLEARDFLRAH